MSRPLTPDERVELTRDMRCQTCLERWDTETCECACTRPAPDNSDDVVDVQIVRSPSEESLSGKVGYAIL